ncbi:MAG: TonB-dependent siderophore receptor [Agriterribacter sp.]
MKHLLFTSIFMFSIVLASAQTGSINGLVLDESNEPLEGATVFLQNTPHKAVTNSDGYYSIANITKGTYTLVVSYVGKESYKQNVVIVTGKATELSLQLNQQQQTLIEITLSSVKNRQYVVANTSVATRTNTPWKDVPQAIQTIPRQVMNDQQVYRLSDVFKHVAGITEQSDFNYVNMRGFLTSSANFMVNGQRNSFFGLASSPQIPYAEKVEVLKGASSVLYGNGAIGGTINIVTKQPRKSFYSDANITYGTLGLIRVQADVTGALNKSKTASALLTIGAESGGSYYDDFENQQLSVTPVISWNISSKTALTSTALLQFGHQTSPSSGLPVIGANDLFAVPLSFRYAGDDSKFNTTGIQEQLHLTHHFSDKLSSNIWLSYAGRRTDANFYQPGGTSPNTDSISRLKAFYRGKLRGYGVNAYINYTFKTGKIEHNLVGGFDYNNAAEYYPKGEKYWYAPYISMANADYSGFNTNFITPGYYNADNEKYGPTRSVGVYIQDQVSLAEKLKALLAIRYDNYLNRSYFLMDGSEYFDSSKAHAVVPKVGLVYEPVQQLSVYGSYSEAFQPQYSNSRAAGGPFDPLQAKQWEFGAKGEFFGKRLVPTITWYHIRQTNVLKPDPNDATGVRQMPTGEVTSRGWEITLTGSITKQWNVIANYAHNKIFISKSTIDGEKGGGFGDTPSDMVSIWTTYQFTGFLKGVKIGGGYRYSTKRNVYGLILPAYDVWDALIAYQFKKFGLAVNGFNLTNKRYAIGSFGTSYYFPGAPRNVQVSLSYNL